MNIYSCFRSSQVYINFTDALWFISSMQLDSFIYPVLQWGPSQINDYNIPTIFHLKSHVKLEVVVLARRSNSLIEKHTSRVTIFTDASIYATLVYHEDLIYLLALLCFFLSYNEGQLSCMNRTFRGPTQLVSFVTAYAYRWGWLKRYQ